MAFSNGRFVKGFKGKRRRKGVLVKGDYQRRNDFLKSLGFTTYRDYLESDLWRGIRQKVLERDSFRCRACDAIATVVHHQEYTEAVLKGKTLRGLWSLCRSCHEKIEFSAGKKVMKLKKVQSKLDREIGRLYAAKRRSDSP